MADIFLQCVQKNIPPGVTIEFELVSFCRLFVRLPPNFRAGGRAGERGETGLFPSSESILPVENGPIALWTEF